MKNIDEQIKDVQNWRTVGDKFIFMDRTMQVKLIFASSLINRVGMIANYFDNHGVIQEYEFNYEQLQLLINEGTL